MNNEYGFSISSRLCYKALCIDRKMFGTTLTPPQEFRAIIGHEFGHLACGDLHLVRHISSIILSLPVEIVMILYRASREALLKLLGKSVCGPLVEFCDRIVAPFSLEAILQLRELRADAWTVAQTGDPVALRNGLRALMERSRTEGAARGMTEREIAEYEHHPFGTHPPLVRRELHLIGYLS